MKCSIGITVSSADVPAGLGVKIGDYLEIEMSRRDYGQGVTAVYMGASCVGPVPGCDERFWRDSATGTVIDKKYTKSKRELEVGFTLSYADVTSLDENGEQLGEAFKRGVLGTCAEVKAMRIRDFDVDRFYGDLEKLFDDRGWIKDPDMYKILPYERQSDAYRGPSGRGTEQRFPLPGESSQMDFRLYANPFLDNEVKPGLLAQFVRVSDYLAGKLAERSYGHGVDTMAVYVWCYTPCDVAHQIHDPRVFNNEDWKEYVKARRILIWNIQMDCGEVLSSDEDELAQIVKREFLASRAEVRALGIEDFDTDALYRDIEALLETSDFAKTATQEYDSGRHQGIRFEMHPLLQDWDVKRGFVEQVARVSEYLETRLSKKDYGAGVARVTMAVWCNTGHRDLQPYFGTGWRKYFESRRAMLSDVRLDYAKVKASAGKRFVGILKRGILDTQSGVEALEIKDFHVEPFYRDIELLLTDKDWLEILERDLKAVHDRAMVGVQEEAHSSIPEGIKMPEADFWDLIRESVEAGDGAIQGQLAYLEGRLAGRSEKDIVAFELTLRDLIRRSCHYNVMALLKVIADYVSDDTLLYFQCRLILYGRDVFYQAIKDPNKLTAALDDGMGEGEGLLLAADNAFLCHSGEDTDKELPRSVASAYYNYDLGGPVLGKPWEEGPAFDRRYARLIRLHE